MAAQVLDNTIGFTIGTSEIEDISMSVLYTKNGCRYIKNKSSNDVPIEDYKYLPIVIIDLSYSMLDGESHKYAIDSAKSTFKKIFDGNNMLEHGYLVVFGKTSTYNKIMSK